MADKYPYFDNALGCVVRNKYDRIDRIKRLEDKHGTKFEEVGTESVEKIHKYHEKTREANYKKGWEDADKNLSEVL